MKRRSFINISAVGSLGLMLPLYGYMVDNTGEQKYLDAAIKVLDKSKMLIYQKWK